MTDPIPETGDLFDLAESAKYLHTTERWMRRAVEERRIEFIRVGRLLRFRRSTLDGYLQANTVAAER